MSLDRRLQRLEGSAPNPSGPRPLDVIVTDADAAQAQRRRKANPEAYEAARAAGEIVGIDFRPPSNEPNATR